MPRTKQAEPEYQTQSVTELRAICGRLRGERNQAVEAVRAAAEVLSPTFGQAKDRPLVRRMLTKVLLATRT